MTLFIPFSVALPDSVDNVGCREAIVDFVVPSSNDSNDLPGDSFVPSATFETTPTAV